MSISNALQSNRDQGYGILVDVTRCTGCERCVVYLAHQAGHTLGQV